ncbi:MAG: hypothetical protein Q4G23_03005 [Clostridia bacterium]|nr:hypothetical protein [Clostridia bacterium]
MNNKATDKDKKSIEKKKYESPQLSVTEIMTEDIITTSVIQLAPTDANFIGKTTIEIDF